VARLRTGDAQAFHVFFDTYFSALFRYSMRYFVDDADRALEASEATLAKAMCELDTYRGEISLFEWLVNIANRVLSGERN
jgi:RNA polymerase sigma-70 factor (ECF subfamily)